MLMLLLILIPSFLIALQLPRIFIKLAEKNQIGSSTLNGLQRFTFLNFKIIKKKVSKLKKGGNSND